MSKDRITVAWELRKVLHAWVIANPYSKMEALFQAFPDYPEETLRKSINRLRQDGDLMMNGRRGVAGYLSAITTHIKPEWITRQKLTEGHLNSRQDKFEAAEEVRQKILDIANRDGVVTSKGIADELLINLDHAMRSLNKMAEQGEVLKHGKTKGITYTPILTKTMSAEDMRERAANRKLDSIAKDMKKQSLKAAKREPWRYVHRGMDRDTPLKGQGGQGAVRREFGIQASAGML